MQGVVSFSGRLATLGQQTSPAAASGGQTTSDMAQAHSVSRSMSDPLASITSRIHRGTLEDQPSGSFDDPAVGVGQRQTGSFGAAPKQGLWDSPSAATRDDLFDLLDVLPGKPMGPESEAAGPGMLAPEQQPAGFLSSSLLTRRSTPSQPAALLQMLAQQPSPRKSLFQAVPQAASPMARQLPAVAPQPQQPQWQQLQQQLQQLLQQQPDFKFSPAGFQTGSSNTDCMHSSQIPQLQSFPASQELTRVSSWDVSSSSRIGGRVSRRGRSHSLRSSPRSPVQSSGQEFAFSEAQHASQQQGQGLPAMPLRRATSLSSGPVGPFGRAPLSRSPSMSPSPAALRQGLQQVYPPPCIWYPEGSSEGGQAGPGQGGTSPLVPTPHTGASRFWHQRGGLQGLHPVTRHGDGAGSEPGVFHLMWLGARPTCSCSHAATQPV